MQKAALLDRIKTLSHPIHPEPLDHETRLTTLSDIKCVAFDFYGTMFISGVGDIGVDEKQAEGNARLFEESLIQLRFSTADSSVGEKGLKQFQQSIDLHINRMKKKGIEHPEPNVIDVWQNVLTELLQSGEIKGEVTRQKAIQLAIEFEFRVNTVWPLPDLSSILKHILDQDLKLGIISNSQFYTPLTFEALFGASTHAFGFDPDLQIWSYKAGMKKPSVSFYRLFTDELSIFNLKPEQVLYIGNDLFKDVIPAKKLGMKTALYVGDRRSVRHKKEDLLPEYQQPELIIDDLSQIIECLE